MATSQIAANSLAQELVTGVYVAVILVTVVLLAGTARNALHARSAERRLRSTIGKVQGYEATSKDLASLTFYLTNRRKSEYLLYVIFRAESGICRMADEPPSFVRTGRQYEMAVRIPPITEETTIELYVAYPSDGLTEQPVTDRDGICHFDGAPPSKWHLTNADSTVKLRPPAA